MEQGRPLEKELSSSSEATIRSLSDLDTRVRGLEDELRDYDAQVATAKPDQEATAAVKNALAQLIGVADQVQYQEIDGIVTSELTSGRSMARHYRKAIHARIDAVRDHATDLYAKLNADADAGWVQVAGETKEDEAAAAGARAEAEVEAETTTQPPPHEAPTPADDDQQGDATLKDDDDDAKTATDDAPPAAATSESESAAQRRRAAAAGPEDEPATGATVTAEAPPHKESSAPTTTTTTEPKQKTESGAYEIKVNVTRTTARDASAPASAARRGSAELEAIRTRLAEIDARRAALDEERVKLEAAQREKAACAAKRRFGGCGPRARRSYSQPAILIIENPLVYKRSRPVYRPAPVRPVVYDPVFDLFHPRFFF